MKRREFIMLVGGATAAWPVTVRAQQSTMPVVGFLNAASPQGYPRPLSAFLKGLGEAGYVDGRNVVIQYRWAEGHNERLPAMAADLVQSQVTVIAATSTPAALAAKAATSSIPIVFETGGDPIRLGLVAGLNRPGGNVTGAASLAVEVTAKGLELLHELIPSARVIGLLINPNEPAAAEPQEREVLSAARTFALEVHVLNAGTERELDSIFAKLVALQASALVISAGAFFSSHSKQLAELAVRHAIPTIHTAREFATAGGLLSYGSDITDSYRLAGIYTGRILKGEKPADLPVQQATKVELIINLKTAKALGISVPLPILGRADEVIE
ncbi:ABC transporter substrate-binding protein [Bradyrhizobium erythrophlei]|uniref:Putative ABC transport system substrate-binding protein n=1 Tax=Bradyrhizobium erythrophlei TaxID=1437360 RepID=A0A1M7UDS2_9BRAD|nr:ABC transporter substrate-binding protein [Bradyrhizobium erythrophlei]SHN81075.1 putative ABC transport system substrate-binding protein [Bradyrhizobium erythrophlei]